MMNREAVEDWTIVQEVQFGGLPIVCHFGGGVLLEEQSRRVKERVVRVWRQQK
jgi:hypothetical protein